MNFLRITRDMVVQSVTKCSTIITKLRYHTVSQFKLLPKLHIVNSYYLHYLLRPYSDNRDSN